MVRAVTSIQAARYSSSGSRSAGFHANRNGDCKERRNADWLRLRGPSRLRKNGSMKFIGAGLARA